MGDKDVWEISLEVTPCEGAMMPRELIGAFVYCYVVSSSLQHAIECACAALTEDNYNVIDVDRGERINLDEWVPYDDDYPTSDELGEILRTGDVIYGPFLAYEHEYEH